MGQNGKAILWTATSVLQGKWEMGKMGSQIDSAVTFSAAHVRLPSGW
jgi:hypothetical protein